MIPITLFFAYLDYNFELKNGFITYNVDDTKSLLFLLAYMIILSILMIVSLASKNAYEGFAMLQSVFMAILFVCMNTFRTTGDTSFSVVLLFIYFITIIPFLVYFVILKIKKL